MRIAALEKREYIKERDSLLNLLQTNMMFLQPNMTVLLICQVQDSISYPVKTLFFLSQDALVRGYI